MRDPMLIFHFIGLAMALGTSFAFMFLGMASSKMEKQAGINFILESFAIAKMGNIGIIILIISGGALMTPHWSLLAASPLLIAKFILVLILATLLGIIGATRKKAMKGDAEKHIAKIKMLGQISFLVNLIIVVLAVLHFG